MNPKPALFIDFDGTLCHDRFWRSLPHEPYEKIQTLLFGDDRQMINDWMFGGYTSEQVNELVSREINFPYQELWDVFVEDCKTMNVSTQTLEKIGKLKSEFQTVLITGNMDCFDRFTVPSLHLNKYFDKIANSYTEKRFKSDQNGASFTKVLNEMGAGVGKSIVIDDSPKTCEVFTGLGGIAYLIGSDKDVDYYLDRITT